MKNLIKRLNKAFNLTFDLVHAMNTNDLNLKLGDMPSNTIGEQIWCIIGARESYLKAIINGSWVGFSCSLDDTKSKDKVMLCLEKSAEDSLKYLYSFELNEAQIELLLLLLEHEILHHGQLIRYIYGNKLTFPKSWNERYTV